MPDQKLSRDLKKLTQGSGSSIRNSQLNRDINVPSNAGAVGLGRAAKASSGGGVASPLTEASATTRTYWPIVAQKSVDGFYVRLRRPIKSVTFTDANNETVVLNFANPA